MQYCTYIIYKWYWHIYAYNYTHPRDKSIQEELKKKSNQTNSIIPLFDIEQNNES